MYNGYLCIEPFLLAHGCIIWVYPLVVLVIIYKLKLRNIIYRNALRLNECGNASLEYLLTTSPHLLTTHKVCNAHKLM